MLSPIAEEQHLPEYEALLLLVDDGLHLLNEEVASNSNIDGFDFLVEKVESGLNALV